MLVFLGKIVIPAGTSRNNTNTGAARLNLATLGSHALDSWIRAVTPGTVGNAWTFAAVGDAAGAVTIAVNTTAKTVVVHYHSAVSTVANVEAAIAALTGTSAVIAVDIPGTGATVLTAPADNISATNLAGGAAGAFVIGSHVEALRILPDVDGIYTEIKPDPNSPSTSSTSSTTGYPVGNPTALPFQVGSPITLVGGGGAPGVVAAYSASAANLQVWAALPT